MKYKYIVWPAVISFTMCSVFAHIIFKDLGYFLVWLFPFVVTGIMLMFVISPIYRANKLLTYGIPIPAKIKGVDSIYIGKNSSKHYYIKAIVENDTKIYESRYFYYDPHVKEGDDITIYFNPKKPKQFHVDTREIQLRMKKKIMLI
jgi:hypothetical protein